jgi:signal peptidase
MAGPSLGRWCLKILLLATASLAALTLLLHCTSRLLPFLVAEGSSMEPAIRRGDLLLLRGVGGGVGPGDVIAFHEPYRRGVVVAHRVVEVVELNGVKLFRTKGDANPAPDPWLVPEADVVGVVASVVPALGFLVLVVQSPVAKASTASLLALLIMLDLLWGELAPRGEGRGRRP